MEDEYNQGLNKSEFSFFEDGLIKEHFGILNLELLRGAHIQNDSIYFFKVLNEYRDELTNFYSTFYDLKLTRNMFEGEVFYYLDFPDSKNSLKHSRRLTEFQTLIGLTLLKMYYDKYFELSKIITLDQIKYELFHGGNSSHYKTLLLKDVRENYSENEESKLWSHINRTLSELEKLGWVKKTADKTYLIKASISRLQNLYKEEFENFEDFVESYRNQQL